MDAPSPFASVETYIRGLEQEIRALSQKVEGLEEKLGSIVTPPEDIPLTVPDFVARYPEFEEGLRWKLLHRKTNGLAGAVVEPAVKRGRLRIIPSKFLEWSKTRPTTERLDGTPRIPRR